MLIPCQIYSVSTNSQVIGLFVCFLINWSSCFQFISIATGLNTVWFTAKILIYFTLEIVLASLQILRLSIKYRFRGRTWVFNCMSKTHFYLGQRGIFLRKSCCSDPCSPSIGVTPHIQLYLSVRGLVVKQWTGHSYDLDIFVVSITWWTPACSGIFCWSMTQRGQLFPGWGERSELSIGLFVF